MKAIIFIALLAIASCQFLNLHTMPRDKTNKQKLQDMFNGLWENGGLADPVQIINCFDEPTAAVTVAYVGQMLKDVATTNRAQLIKDTQAFVSQIPQSTTRCIAADDEVTQLAAAYNLTNQPLQQLGQEIVKYVMTNLPSLKQNASTAYFDYFQGMYKQVGIMFGQLIQQIFANTPRVTRARVVGNTALTDLQNLFNGLFEDVNLPGPKTSIQCFDETTAHVTLDFYAAIINDIATNNYPQLVREYEVYKSAIPQATLNCIETNQELDAAYDAYGFNAETPTTLLKKYATYYIKSHPALISSTQTINTDIGNEDYYNAGKLTGTLILTILGNGPSKIQA